MARGRKRSNWLSFTEARQLVHDECIAHRADYYRWYDRNKPKQIPKQPMQAYRDQWVSWNDWLNTNNVFKGGKKVPQRSFVEATAYVHKLKLKSAQMWFEHIRENGLPDDIPSHPELYYKQWVSWPHWLGNTLSKQVEVAQQSIEECGLLYIVQMPQRPANVFKIGVESGGVSAIRDAQAKMGFRVIKLFKMEQGYDWKAMVEQFAKPWWEDDAEWVVPNVNELIFEFGGDLLFA